MTEPQLTSERRVHIELQVGEHLLSGSAARLWLRLAGTAGCTQWFSVCPPGGRFRRGDVVAQVLRLSRATDPGEIRRVDLCHDGAGRLAGLYISTIRCDGRPLHVDQWLAADEPPYRLDATTLDDEDARAYEVRVRTSEALWAGTDARVSLQLEGSRSTTPWMLLHTPGRRLFEAGQTDSFRLYAEDIGALVGVWLRQDGGGAMDGWRVDWIEVDGRRLTFDRWLGRGAGDGRRDAFHRLRPWLTAKGPLQLACCAFAGAREAAEQALCADLVVLEGILGRHGLAVARAEADYELTLDEPWEAWRGRFQEPRALLSALAAERHACSGSCRCGTCRSCRHRVGCTQASRTRPRGCCCRCAGATRSASRTRSGASSGCPTAPGPSIWRAAASGCGSSATPATSWRATPPT
jgi:hypothetical protein